MGFVQNGIVFFSDFFDNNYEERVFAMDTTGVELWSRQAETFLISMEPTNNKNLLVVEDSRMYLLNSQGQAIWSKTDEFFTVLYIWVIRALFLIKIKLFQV